VDAWQTIENMFGDRGKQWGRGGLGFELFGKHILHDVRNTFLDFSIFQ